MFFQTVSMKLKPVAEAVESIVTDQVAKVLPTMYQNDPKFIRSAKRVNAETSMEATVYFWERYWQI